MASHLLLITSTTSLLSLLLLIRMHYGQVGKIASLLMGLGLMTVRIIIITCLILSGVSIAKHLFITFGMTSLTMFPIVHLHFRQLTENRLLKRKDLVHVLPLMGGLVFWVFRGGTSQDHWIGALLFSPVILYYWAMILQSFRKGIWSRHSEVGIVMKNIRQIRGISNVIFATLTIGLAYHLWLLVYDPHPETNFSLNHLILPALLLLASSLKLLLDPDIMHGFDIVPGKVRKARLKPVFTDIWRLEPDKEVVGKRDRTIRDKVAASLKEYIPRIEETALKTELFRTPGLTLEDFASALKIPAFHLAFVFRYHSSESFQEFKKIIQINDAIELIQSGYAKDHTIESLATKVGFASYNPFFVSFKNITGMTPQQYCKSVEA